MLDQLDLCDDLCQIGLASKRSYTFKDGKHVAGRGFIGMFESPATFFDHALHIRLKYVIRLGLFVHPSDNL